MKALHELEFRNEYIETFKGDQSKDRSPRQTPHQLYSLADPTPVPDPHLIGWSEALAKELQLSPPDSEDIRILAGNLIPNSVTPYAMCYAGHQFGNWAGQLGDGRAINLGRIQSRQSSYEIQLKGAGPTAYSRHADGRAVLRSSVREFLISEAMHHLRVPTTRALSLVSTGEEIMRDMFYNGNPQNEPGAIVSRLAPSFLRFGSFELLAAQRDKEQLQKLIDWTISSYFSHLTDNNKVLDWFQEIVRSTANLITEWHRVGFVHGVMNTDNMSILGLTIDYGPFSFLDNYDPQFTPNTTDLPGRRYAFGNQPSIAYWNLGRLANALSLLFEETEELETVLKSYEPIFWKSYYSMMGKKIGMSTVEQQDKQLISEFEKVLSHLQPDMTMFYRALSELSPDMEPEKIRAHFADIFYHNPNEEENREFLDLILNYQERMDQKGISRNFTQELMQANNPRIILRNYLLHQAIEDLEKGDDTFFKKLQEAMKDPYSPTGYEDLVQKRPTWAETKAGCSMLSCSS